MHAHLYHEFALFCIKILLHHQRLAGDFSAVVVCVQFFFFQNWTRRIPEFEMALSEFRFENFIYNGTNNLSRINN